MSMEMDAERIVRRTAAAAAQGYADLAARYGTLEEIADIRQARIADLEKALADKDAELARARVAMQAPLDEDGDDGPPA